MIDGETSQTVVSGGIFDGEPDLDFNEPDTTEGTETKETVADAPEPKEEGANEQPATEDDPADFLTIRYNKTDRKLSRKEAVELAQKGANYDHVKSELDSYRNGPIGKAMKAYADQAGMSVEKYAEMMAQQAETAAEKRAIDELHEKYPDAPEELLKEYARMQREGNKAQAKDAEEAKRQKEWADALAEYPDIKPDAIPQDVHDAVAEGVSPIDALRMHELAELREKVAKLTADRETKQKQEDNRARSIGSAAGVSSGGEADDDFLAGMSLRSRGY